MFTTRRNWAGILRIALVLLSSFLVSHSETSQAQSTGNERCLEFKEVFTGKIWQLNTATGQATSRMGEAEFVDDTNNKTLSPNGLYRADISGAGLVYEVSLIDIERQQKKLLFTFLSSKQPELEEEGEFSIIGWSPDSAYFGFSSIDKQNKRANIHFLLSASSQLITLPLKPYRENTTDTLVPRAQWSNQGHQLAIAISDGIQKTLNIIIPEKGIITRSELESGISLGSSYWFGHPNFYWSPDNKYLIIRYFTRDGLALEIYQIDQGSLSKLAIHQDAKNRGDLDPILERWVHWSTDSKSFFFWSLQAEGEKRWNDIMVFRVDKRQFETLVDHIVYYNLVDSAGDRYAIQRNSAGGKYSIQLVDANGSNLVSMVDNADYIFSTAPYIKRAPIADVSANGRLVVVLWATGEGFTPAAKAHITWMNLDGTSRRQIDVELNAVYSTAWDSAWLGFAGYNMGESERIQIIDTTSGKYYSLLNPTPPTTVARDWSFSVSPNGQYVSVVLPADGGFRQLYLVTLEGKLVKQFHATATRTTVGVWSPDGTQMAYVYSEAKQPQKLVVVDLATLQSRNFNQFGEMALYGLKWTTCNATRTF